MTLDELWAVADGAGVELTEDARHQMTRSREILEAAIARGEAIYGTTTSVGHMRNERVPDEAVHEFQRTLIESHVGAMDEPLSTERVRAAMAARLNGFARGGAGVSPAVADLLTELLNHGIHPVIPEAGSIGAGDIGQLALLGRTLLGRGEVDYDGRRMPAAEALDTAGLSPVDFKAKDALAVIASNALTVGHGALLYRELTRLLLLADLIVATSMETIRANPSVIAPSVAAVRASAGQEHTSERLRVALAESSRVGEDIAPSVQDPLSFRVIPQVHGACRDVLARMEADLTKELNAAADNPLVDLRSEKVFSNGNFHAMNVALTAESLRVALGHVGLLAERRIGHLWNTVLASFGTSGDDPGIPPASDFSSPRFAGIALRFPAAARYTRLRQLAEPISLDIPSLVLDVEDHANNLAEVLRSTEQAAEIVRELLVIELLIGLAMLDDVANDELGRGTRRLASLVRATLDGVAAGTLPHETHRIVSDLLERNLRDLVGTGSDV